LGAFSPRNGGAEVTEGELLLRIASTLKDDIAPAVEAEYPKTQAFMAAVVLQKLGRQLALAPGHAQANDADLDALIADLSATAAATPAGVRRSIEVLRQARDAAALSQLVQSLYANRAELGERRFDELLARVRVMLRAGIERRLEYAE
jgi:hypothetical protein